MKKTSLIVIIIAASFLSGFAVKTIITKQNKKSLILLTMKETVLAITLIAILLLPGFAFKTIISNKIKMQK